VKAKDEGVEAWIFRRAIESLTQAQKADPDNDYEAAIKSVKNCQDTMKSEQT
jgi:hypothetical protein